MSRLRGLFVLSIVVAIGSVSADVPRTQYTGEMKNIAKRLLKYRADREQLDREYGTLIQDLTKTIILTKDKDHDYKDLLKTLKRIDLTVKEYKVIKNRDVGAAAEVFLKETVSVLLNSLELTQPHLAKGLKVGKAGVDASIVIRKMVINRNEASEMSATSAVDLNTLNRLIAKDKEARLRKPAAGKAPTKPPLPPAILAKLPEDDIDEINRWIDGGDRSAFGSRSQRDSFYARHPILEQFREIASFRSPSDEFDDAGGIALLAAPPTFDPATLSSEEFEGWLRNRDKNRPPGQSPTEVVREETNIPKNGSVMSRTEYEIEGKRLHGILVQTGVQKAACVDRWLSCWNACVRAPGGISLSGCRAQCGSCDISPCEVCATEEAARERAIQNLDALDEKWRKRRQ